MVAITCQHLLYPAALPSAPNQLSVLSYNVLLPNSIDGWWTYKMYDPTQSYDIDLISTWNYRRDLIKHKIKTINPDVVCMQEVSPISFEEDFAFMREELGYDGVEMFKRGRFRPATFWRSSKCKLASPPVHKDRTLLTCFYLQGSDGDGVKSVNSNRIWHVLNCHLQAGPQGSRRLRQMDEGINASFKMAKKLKEENPRNPLLIVCGDFNGGSECGAVRYLEDGLVGPSFLEDGEQITSREKSCPLATRFQDIATLVPRSEPPPTLVVAELISQMVRDNTSAYEMPEFCHDVISRLTKCYKKYASCQEEHEEGVDGKVMGIADVEKWLIDINKQVGRGSEFRAAAREMGWKDTCKVDDEETGEGESTEKSAIVLPSDGKLSLKGFLNVYTEELRGGKFWGIAYDLSVMGQPLPSLGQFHARFDRMYCTEPLMPTAIVDTIATNSCPNDMEPSDHLPVAANFVIADIN